MASTTSRDQSTNDTDGHSLEASTMRECLAKHGLTGWQAENAVRAVGEWLHSWQDAMGSGDAETGRGHLERMLEVGR